MQDIVVRTATTRPKGTVRMLTECNVCIALEARRTRTRALEQALMQELLTGRTRLV